MSVYFSRFCGMQHGFNETIRPSVINVHPKGFLLYTIPHLMLSLMVMIV